MRSCVNIDFTSVYPLTTLGCGFSLGMSVCCNWTLYSSKHVFSVIIHFPALYCCSPLLLAMTHNITQIKKISCMTVTKILFIKPGNSSQNKDMYTTDEGLDKKRRARLFALTFTCLHFHTLGWQLCMMYILMHGL